MAWASGLRPRIWRSRSVKGYRRWGSNDDTQVMDPLSITVGTIAILELSNRIVHVLKGAYRAPEEIIALSNEIVDLRLVFELTEQIIEDQSLHQETPDLMNGIASLVDRARGTLERIDAINHKLWPVSKINSQGKRLISRSAWIKEKSNVRELREQLRETRHNVHAALSALTSAKICTLSANHLTLQTSVADLRVAIVEGFDAHQQQIKSNDAASEFSITNNETKSIISGRGRTFSSASTLVSVTATKTNVKCEYPCPCHCHVRSSYKTPVWLKNTFGMLFASYAGSPVWGRQPCNYLPCQRSGASQSSYTWHFPGWMVAKAVAFSISKSTLTGIGGSWTLHIPKTLTGDNPVWRFLNYGTVPQLVDVISSGVASACDMNEDGKSLLHFAVEFERPDMCEYLIQQGVNSSFQDGAGITASMMAYSKATPASASPQQVSNIAALHQMFHNEETFEYMDLSPLHMCMANHPDSFFALQLSLNFIHIDKQDILGRTPLIWAASSNKSSIAALLLEWNADVSLVDRQQKSALHWAMISQSYEVARLLLEHGADTEVKDIFGRTPLHEVAKVANSEKLISLLLDHNAQVDAEDYGFKRTPLHLAAYHGRAENLKALASRGADIECPTSGGRRTALLDAIAYNRVPTVEELLRLGADVNSIDADGRSILHLSAKFGCLAIIKALRLAVLKMGVTSLSITLADLDGKTAKKNYYSDRKLVYYGEESVAEEEEQAFLELEKAVLATGLQNESWMIGDDGRG